MSSSIGPASWTESSRQFLHAPANPVNIVILEAQRPSRHPGIIRRAPVRLHHSTAGMPVHPFQNVRDLVHQHVCQQHAFRSGRFLCPFPDPVVKHRDRLPSVIRTRYRQRSGEQTLRRVAVQFDLDAAFSARRPALSSHPPHFHPDRTEHRGRHRRRKVNRSRRLRRSDVHCDVGMPLPLLCCRKRRSQHRARYQRGHSFALHLAPHRALATDGNQNYNWKVSAPSPANVTALLRQWGAGDPAALEQLIPLVYGELHTIARRYMHGERHAPTMQPTALVNEAYLRLAGVERQDWKDRAYFFAVAAQSMRRILVEAARARGRLKRGGSADHVAFHDSIDAAPLRSDTLVALDDALEALARFDPRKARVVELRFFGGLSVEETAEVLSVSAQTVMRDWKLARAWLTEELQNPPRS